MANEIGRIFGGSNYGVGGYVPQRKNNEEGDTQAKPNVPQNIDELQVDPDKVMELLGKINYFVPVSSESVQPESLGAEDSETASRVAGYIDSFEQVFAIIEKEFENPELVMNAVMDKLLGLV